MDGRRFLISERVVQDLILAGITLMNIEARLYNSFLKEFAPLPR